jgi:cytochrome P450
VANYVHRDRPVAQGKDNSMATSLKQLRDQDPYPFFEERLNESPVCWDEEMKAWLVLGYTEARYVQLHEDLFRHPYATIPTAADIYGGPRGVLLLQGEEHQSVHNYLLKHFTPMRVAKNRQEYIADLIGHRLDAFGDRTRIDLASDFGGIVPSDVIAALLGLDWQNEALMAQCRTWNRSMFRWTETFGEDEDAYVEAKAAAEHLNDVLLPVIRERKGGDGDDLISLLWRDGAALLDSWGEDEVLAQARVLFFAGTDTTTHLIQNTIYLLVAHPSAQARLRGNEAAIADFVEESLRFFAPVQFRVRVATQDVEIGGMLIREGDRVHPVNAAANRDPAHYECPAQFNDERSSVKDHLAFNVGPRYCVGAALSRGEAVESLVQILDRYQSLAWDGDAEPPINRGYMPRSFTPLNVIVEPRRSS